MPQLNQQQLKELGLDTLADRVSEHVFKSALTELLNQLSDEEVDRFNEMVERAADFEVIADYVADTYPTFISLLEKHQHNFVDRCIAQIESTA